MNLSQLLKSEIIRLSRKEIKSQVQPLRSSNFSLKQTVADLKRKITALEATNKQLMASYKKSQPQVSAEEVSKARITARTITKLREKLGVSQDSFAKLLGVSSQAVYAMEHKEGRIKLRQGTLTALLAVRGLGKREVQKKLEELEADTKPNK